jgi:esterase
LAWSSASSGELASNRIAIARADYLDGRFAAASDACAEVLAPFAALSGDRDAQRRARAQLSPHLGEDQLDRLVDIGAVVTPGVAAHFAGLWNTGVPDAPATSAFDGPVLVIRGGADGFVTEQLVDAISSRFPDAEVQVIDKGGHWLHVEYAEKVAAMILDFADGVVGVTS